MLVVEDDPDTASALISILRYGGNEVLFAGTVSGAMKQLNEKPEAVVLDLMLPDGNGVEILRHIRGKNLPIRVLVTTASSDQEQLDAVRDLKADKLLKKPIDLSELLKSIK